MLINTVIIYRQQGTNPTRIALLAILHLKQNWWFGSPSWSVCWFHPESALYPGNKTEESFCLRIRLCVLDPKTGNETKKFNTNAIYWDILLLADTEHPVHLKNGGLSQLHNAPPSPILQSDTQSESQSGSVVVVGLVVLVVVVISTMLLSVVSGGPVVSTLSPVNGILANLSLQPQLARFTAASQNPVHTWSTSQSWFSAAGKNSQAHNSLPNWFWHKTGQTWCSCCCVRIRSALGGVAVATPTTAELQPGPLNPRLEFVKLIFKYHL